MKLLRWLITFSYAGFIFYLSSRTWGGPPLFPHADKVIHFMMYALLAGLFLWSLRVTTLRKRAVIFPLAVVMAALYGITDEAHQSIVPGRSMDFFDWLADLAGAFAGGYTAFHLSKLKFLSHRHSSR